MANREKTALLLAQNTTTQDPSLVYFRQGMDAYSAGDLTAAKKSFQKTLQINPQRIEAQKALKRLSPPMAPPSSQSIRIYKKGLDAFFEGDKETAQQLWEEAIRVDSNNEYAKNGLARLARK